MLTKSTEYEVTEDETRILFLKIIEQSIRDYTNLAKSKIPIEIQYFSTAECFLFEQGYTIKWGDLEVTMEDILEYLQVEVEWFRRKILKLTKD